MAIGMLAGGTYGAVAGHAVIALLVGAAGGLIAATLVFLIDRRR